MNSKVDGLSHEEKACCKSGENEPSGSCLQSEPLSGGANTKSSLEEGPSEDDIPEEGNNVAMIVLIVVACVAGICIFVVASVVYLRRLPDKQLTPQIMNGDVTRSDSTFHDVEENGDRNNVEASIKVMVDKVLVERLNSISESINGEICSTINMENTIQDLDDAVRTSVNKTLMKDSTVSTTMIDGDQDMDIDDAIIPVDSTNNEEEWDEQGKGRQEALEFNLEARLRNLRRSAPEDAAAKHHVPNPPIMASDYLNVKPNYERQESSVDCDVQTEIEAKENDATGPAVEPTENDVLFGRGWITNTRKGNVSFRNEALKLRSWYEASNKEEKSSISELLLESMKSQGHRFLELCIEDGLWHEVTENRAHKMARQALKKKRSSSGSGAGKVYAREGSELEEWG